jgi:murein DD-endopeptidase MepM/ murein hydrolase activator NlpD
MTYTNSPDSKQNHQLSPKSLLKQGASLIGSMATIGLITAEAQAANSSLIIPIEAIQSNPAPTITPPSVSKPLKVKTTVKLSPPQISVPSKPSSRATTLPLGGKNSYLDPTSYSTRGNQNKPQSPTVIISDRATGCQTVASQGTIQSCGSEQTTVRITGSRNKPNGQTGPNVTLARRQSLTRASNYPYRITLAKPIVRPQYSHAARPQHIVPNGNTALLFPLSIPARISSTFGWRVHPLTGSRRMHYGTDIAAPTGTPVLAAYGGEVAIADNLGGYGLTVILRHEGGTQESRYAHLSEIFVNPGQWIEQGSVIGLVGSSGFSTGPHLHFEWRHLTQKGWVAVDAGLHLEYALDNLIKSMAIAQAHSTP